MRPVYLVVDCTGPGAAERLPFVAASLERFIRDLRTEDDSPPQAVHVALITLHRGGAKLARPLAAVAEFEPPRLTAESEPGELRAALELLDMQVKATLPVRPLVILFAGGATPTGCDEVIARLRRRDVSPLALIEGPLAPSLRMWVQRGLHYRILKYRRLMQLSWFASFRWRVLGAAKPLNYAVPRLPFQPEMESDSAVNLQIIGHGWAWPSFYLDGVVGAGGGTLGIDWNGDAIEVKPSHYYGHGSHPSGDTRTSINELEDVLKTAENDGEQVVVSPDDLYGNIDDPTDLLEPAKDDGEYTITPFSRPPSVGNIWSIDLRCSTDNSTSVDDYGTVSASDPPRTVATERGFYDVDPQPCDQVDCTVFAPPSVTAGESALVQVVAHLATQAEAAQSLATLFDDSAAPRGRMSLGALVERGAKLSFELLFRGLFVSETSSLIWRGELASVQFEVGVPAEAHGVHIGHVYVRQNDVLIGKISFKIAVGAPSTPTATGDATRIQQAFISYASEDRGKVLSRVQMLKKVGIKTFQDVLDLDPGDRWERELYLHIDQSDVLFLFWSSFAKASEWVEKEWRYGLERKGDEFIDPVIIEGPPIVEPPDELAHLHFNDRILYVMKVEEDSGRQWS